MADALDENATCGAYGAIQSIALGCGGLRQLGLHCICC